MPWSIKRDPQLESIPTYKHPDRCLNCGCSRDNHDASVGCLTDGGTKYIENAEGAGRRVCSCLQFVPISTEQLAKEAGTNVIHVEETAKLQETSK